MARRAGRRPVQPRIPGPRPAVRFPLGRTGFGHAKKPMANCTLLAGTLWYKLRPQGPQ